MALVEPPIAVTPEQEELAGLDALAQAESAGRRSGQGSFGAVWSATWPKLVAVVVVLVLWQVVAWSGWRPWYVLPGPAPVLRRLLEDLSTAATWHAVATTMRRALLGFSLAVVIGLALGVVVSRSEVLRRGIGSLLTGVQTMPSIAWFPLALILFQFSEGAIFFVVVIGGAPSVANGVISGIDHVPPLLIRAGRTLGAQGWSLLRLVILPAALPAIVGGLKQGWAFAWRSLLAGELIVILGSRPSLGARLELMRQSADSVGLIATMLLLLCIGVAVDAAGFGPLERHLRRRRGLEVS